MRLALLLALALGCAHVAVEPREQGSAIEVNALGQVEVDASADRVRVTGSGISNALGRLLTAVVGLFP